MNYCPDCGGPVEYQRTEYDVATEHIFCHCPACTADWEETVQKGVMGKLLHISPVEGGEQNARARKA